MGKWDFAMKSKALGGQSYLIRKVEMTYQWKIWRNGWATLRLRF